MKMTVLSRILSVLGLVPFAAATVLGLPIFRADSLTYGEFLLLWSYLFWPTYILGVLLLAAGILLRIRSKKQKRTDEKESASCSTEK